MEQEGNSDSDNEDKEADPEVDPEIGKERCPEEGDEHQAVEEQEGAVLFVVPDLDEADDRVDCRKRSEQKDELEHLSFIEQEGSPEYGNEQDQEEEDAGPFSWRTRLRRHNGEMTVPL